MLEDVEGSEFFSFFYFHSFFHLLLFNVYTSVNALDMSCHCNIYSKLMNNSDMICCLKIQISSFILCKCSTICAQVFQILKNHYLIMIDESRYIKTGICIS